MVRVLVAVSETDVDGAAVQEILGLLRPDHELIFVTVRHAAVQALVTDAGLGAPVILADDTWDELDAATRQSADDQVRQLLNELGLQGRIRVEMGDPGERICAVAVEENADLIVVGSSHHAGVLRRLLGASVADDVTHHAPCPVLLARHQASPK